MPTVYICRHGQTDWNAEARLQGQADTDLNATGRAQARRNGERLRGLIADPDAFDFVSSPLKRTRQTMEIARAAMGLDPAGYRTDERLKELHFGDWQGFTFAELEAASPGSTAGRDTDKWNYVPPGAAAESYAALALRIVPWLEAIDRPTVCVTHGGIVRSLFRMVGGYSEVEAAAMTVPQDLVLKMEGGELVWL
jgi:broad specificity phosphatase PhoE